MRYAFKLDDIVLPLEASGGFSQTYSWKTAETITDMMNGRGVKQGTWKKIRTTLSGSGWMPSGLGSIDTMAEHTLYCGAPRSAASATPSILLERPSRTDEGYTPIAWAVVAGELIETPCTLDAQTNVLTCTPVAGADGYRAHFFPILTVFCEPVEDEADETSAGFSWTLTAEEVTGV